MATDITPARGLESRLVPTPAGVQLSLWQVPTFFSGLLVFLAVAAGVALRPARAVREFESDLARVRAALAQPGEPAQQIVALGESLVTRIPGEPQKAGEAHLLLGCLYARLGGPSTVRHEDFRIKAVKEFEQAEALGVSAVDLPRLQYQIGTLLCQGRGDLRRGIEYLNQSIAQGADDPAAGYGLLVAALLRLQPPDYEAALRANQKQLEATVSEATTAEVRFRRAQILIERGLRPEAIKVLDRIGPAAPLALRTAARSLQARCCMEEELWNMAVPLWQEVLANHMEPPGKRAHILYLLGQCTRKLDPPDDVRAAAAWEEAIKAGGDEGQAAALSLAELRLLGSDPAGALVCFAQALEKVHTAADYHNSLIPLARARLLFEQGCRLLREAHAFVQAQQIAELYKRIALPGHAQERHGEIADAWARDLEEQALHVDTGRSELEEQSRAQFRQAGMAYEQSARQRALAEQPDLFWRSATSFSRGGVPAEAVIVLQELVKLPLPPQRQAEGWFALGEAHQALGHRHEARQAFYKSIEVPTSPVASRARLQLAAAEIQQKNFDQAEAILQQNLRAAGTTPDREAHEKSLYLLGNLLYQRGDYLKASVILKEAVRQYPANTEGVATRAHLIDCYLKLAQETSGKLKNPEGYADVHAHLVRVHQDWLDKALEVYQKMTDWLDRSGHKPPPADAAVLKEVSFAVAQSRYDLGEFLEAQRLYQQLLQRYARQEPSLEACAKLYQCYGALSGQEKADALLGLRTAVETSLAELPTMPLEGFVGPHAVSREDWGRWLRRLQAFLPSIPPDTVTR
jgi:tetratricopeptide (TPR) repeat protein